MGYEVLTAFFLEAGFLGIALFGRRRVGPGLHMFAVAMVAVGTLISATWIIAANSWMQTPAGFTTNAAGQFVPVDWWAIVFNPSFPYRLVHTVLAAFLTTRLRGRRDRRLPPAARQYQPPGPRHVLDGDVDGALVTPIQIIAGDQHGLNTLEHQPAKIAAIEGHYETHANHPADPDRHS